MAIDCFDESPIGVFHMEGENAIPQGTDWDTTIKYKENGSIVDLSTYTGRLQVRKDYGKEIIIELSSAAGTIVLASGAGDSPNVQLKWVSGATAALALYDGIYDLELTSPQGTILKFLEGRWSLRREVTI